MAMGLALVVAIAAPGPFLAPFWVVVLASNPMTLANTSYQAWVMGSVAGGAEPSPQVVVILLSWVQLGHSREGRTSTRGSGSASWRADCGWYRSASASSRRCRRTSSAASTTTPSSARSE